MQKYSIFLFLSVFFFSCKMQKQDLNMAVFQDSLSIQTGFLNAYFNEVKISGSSYFQGYDPSTNELLLFDLNAKRQEMKIKLKTSFQDSVIGRLIQFYIHTQDSIFLLTENLLLITDTTGKIKYEKDIADPLRDADGGEVFLLDFQNQVPLYFDPLKGDLLLHIMCNCGLGNPSYYTKRIEAKLNLASGRVTIFDYHFPERYRHGFYGQNVFPFREVNGPLSIVSFESDDSVYVFNRDVNVLRKYKCRSRYQQIDFISFDTSFYNDNNRIGRLNEHITVSPIYEKILFDPYRNLYYRFFLRELLLKDEKGIYTNPLTKDLVIMVLNKDFKIVQENNVGNSYLWYYSFVTDKGLYIQKKSNNTLQNSNNYAHFSVFSWN